MLILIVICSILSLESLSAKSMSSIMENYQNFCEQAASDDKVFSNFKRSPIYQDVLEHVTCQQGLNYLAIVQKNDPDFLSHCDQIMANDRIGNPVLFNYSPFGSFSPTTLRYLKVAADLRREFGDLSQFDIVEIGGGYGGQCKLLFELTGFASYTLIDLPECNHLSRKYLNQMNVENVNYIDCDQLELSGHYDLVISNFAFSEVEREEQLPYMHRILNPTPRGYMTGNFRLKNYIFPFLDIEDVVQLLTINNRRILLNNENPITGEMNQTLIWKPIKGAKH
jgi:hypothetical protein